MQITKNCEISIRLFERGFRQFLDVNARRFRKRFEFETSLEKRQNTSFRPTICCVNYSPAQAFKSSFGHVHTADGIFVMRVKSGRQNNHRRLQPSANFVQCSGKGGAINIVISASRQWNIAGRSKPRSFSDLVPTATAGEGRVVVNRNKSDLAVREEMSLRPIAVQSTKICDDNRPIPGTDHNLRSQGHRIEEAVAGCAISTRVVGGRSSDDECSLDATIDQIEGSLHRETGCSYRCVECAGRNATILRIQPPTAGL